VHAGLLRQAAGQGELLEPVAGTERDVAGDRRGVSLALTLDGATVLEQAEAKMCAWLSEVLALVGREASDHVTTAMATLGEALAAHREAREAAPVVG